jgi:hypothetical protein
MKNCHLIDTNNNWCFRVVEVRLFTGNSLMEYDMVRPVIAFFYQIFALAWYVGFVPGGDHVSANFWLIEIRYRTIVVHAIV